jgi:hypothetical protein
MKGVTHGGNYIIPNSMNPQQKMYVNPGRLNIPGMISKNKAQYFKTNNNNNRESVEGGDAMNSSERDSGMGENSMILNDSYRTEPDPIYNGEQSFNPEGSNEGEL